MRSANKAAALTNRNEQSIVPKQRESNLELFRIITMLLIVATIM